MILFTCAEKRNHFSQKEHEIKKYKCEKKTNNDKKMSL